MSAGDEMVRGLREILAGHAEYPRIGGVACHGCDWQSWEAGGTYDDHLAHALAAHVLGLVTAGKAEAWDEGYETRAATLGMTADPNPYRADGLAGEAS